MPAEGIHLTALREAMGRERAPSRSSRSRRAIASKLPSSATAPPSWIAAPHDDALAGSPVT